MKARNLGICIVVGGSLLLLSSLSAQSLGEVARASKTSRKASRVITNDTLPEAQGPANGAATMPITKAAMKESLPDEAGENPNQASGKASAEAADSAKEAQPEKELREQVGFLTSQIASVNARIESEPNEATRETLQKLAASYQEQRDKSQQELDQLIAAKSKDKAAK
jgi:hypothetical protein